jgi:hypothetical protein
VDVVGYRVPTVRFATSSTARSGTGAERRWFGARPLLGSGRAPGDVAARGRAAAGTSVIWTAAAGGSAFGSIGLAVLADHAREPQVQAVSASSGASNSATVRAGAVLLADHRGLAAQQLDAALRGGADQRAVD